MNRALELAERGRRRVEPNPRVGCVLVRDGAIIGEGWHDSWGGHHAEIVALANAGLRFTENTGGTAGVGVTAYVSLEPCNHSGKTPPCTEALIRAGVREVVAAVEDPNPAVRGAGFKRLREADIDVTVGPGAAEAERLNRGFLHFHRTGRPYGLAKWAMTLDGKIADHERRSKWITGEPARAHARALRDECDAILVGIGTVLADDPALKRDPASPIGAVTTDAAEKREREPGEWAASLPEAPSRPSGATEAPSSPPKRPEDAAEGVARGRDATIDSVLQGIAEFRQELESFGRSLSLPSAGESPVVPPAEVATTPQSAPPLAPRPFRRIILDTHARTPLTAKCVMDARDVETWIVLSDAKRNKTVRALTDLGCRVISMPPDEKGRVDLAALWQELGARGVQQILVEGGGEVLAAAFAAGLIREAAVYVAPLLLGGRDAIPALAGHGFPLSAAPRLTDVRWEQVGEDLCGRGSVA